MNPLEITATVLGIANIVLLIRQNIWCWPVGIAMVSLYVYIFYQAQLFSDMGLQVVYIVLQAYGWYYWLNGGRAVKDQVPITRITPRAAIGWAAAALLGTTLLGYGMATYTSAALPYWDATTTVLSLIAQYLLARKILENWALWVIVDVLSIGIYMIKGLYVTTFLYTVFLGMASNGYFVWRHNYLEARTAAVAEA